MFVPTHALCWKWLKSGAPKAKMTKRADPGLKTLFCSKLRNLLKIAKKWCAQCENDKTFSSRALKHCYVRARVRCWKSLKSGAPSAKMTRRVDLKLKTSVLYKLVHFAEKHYKVVRPVRKWQDVLISSSKLLFCTNSCTLLKIARKSFAQCKNDKRCWSRDENAVL